MSEYIVVGGARFYKINENLYYNPDTGTYITQDYKEVKIQQKAEETAKKVAEDLKVIFSSLGLTKTEQDVYKAIEQAQEKARQDYYKSLSQEELLMHQKSITSPPKPEELAKINKMPVIVEKQETYNPISSISIVRNIPDIAYSLVGQELVKKTQETYLPIEKSFMYEKGTQAINIPEPKISKEYIDVKPLDIFERIEKGALATLGLATDVYLIKSITSLPKIVNTPKPTHLIREGTKLEIRTPGKTELKSFYKEYFGVQAGEITIPRKLYYEHSLGIAKGQEINKLFLGINKNLVSLEKVKPSFFDKEMLLKEYVYSSASENKLLIEKYLTSFGKGSITLTKMFEFLPLENKALGFKIAKASSSAGTTSTGLIQAQAQATKEFVKIPIIKPIELPKPKLPFALPLAPATKTETKTITPQIQEIKQEPLLTNIQTQELKQTQNPIQKTEEKPMQRTEQIQELKQGQKSINIPIIIPTKKQIQKPFQITIQEPKQIQQKIFKIPEITKPPKTPNIPLIPNIPKIKIPNFPKLPNLFKEDKKQIKISLDLSTKVKGKAKNILEIPLSLPKQHKLKALDVVLPKASLKEKRIIKQKYPTLLISDFPLRVKKKLIL